MRPSFTPRRRRSLRSTRSSFLAALLAAACALPPAAIASVDVVARLLAGREVEESWAAYERRIGSPLRQWASAEVERLHGETVFYPFSGPDFPTVNLLYPGAARYILVASQHAGAPPPLERMDPALLRRQQQRFARLWGFYASTGFFRTDQLDAEGARAGVTDLLMGFASRLGYEVSTVDPIRVAANGDIELHPGRRDDASTWASVRLVLKQAGRTSILDYVRGDLSDMGLARAPSMRTFVERAAANRTLFKAASHLPQRPQFSVLRAAVLAAAPSVLQDETGIDYALLSSGFDVTLYGRYERAHRLFARSMNRALAEAYAERGDVRPLGFRVGYEKLLGSAVQVAVRRNAGDLQALERRVTGNLERYAARPRLVYLSRGLAATAEEAAYLDEISARLPVLGGAVVVSILLDRDGTIRDASVDKGADARAGEAVRRMRQLPPPPASLARRGDALVLTLGAR